MPRERAGTGPHQLESPKSSVSSGSSCGRISPGGGVASVLAETITSRRAQQQQPQQQELQAESARRRHLALPATGASRQRRRPGPLSVESDWHEPFGAALKPDPHRIPAAARSARDLRPRHLGLVKFPGDLDSWGGDSARAHVRAVSVRGGESLVELNTLHKLAERRAAQLQRHKSLALAVWDGRHDLVSAEELGSTQAAGQAEETCLPLCTSVPALSLMLILCGCGSQLPYELMNSVDRGCGALIAVCEAAFGLAATAPVALRQHSWSVPLPTHACVAGVAVLYPLLLNQALASPLPVVLLSTLKNGNLVANALVGMLLLGKRYSSRQLVSIAVVSGGLVLTALSARASSGRQDDSGAGADVLLTREGVVAAGCLAGALLARALSGGLQEAAFAKCDGTRASADEMLFFQNLFGLPVLLVRGVLLSRGDAVNGIVPHAVKWWHEPLLGSMWPWPSIFGLLFANLIFSHACKFVCTKLIGHRDGGSLHTTLVLTLQKFVAFVVSVLFLSPDAGQLRTSSTLWLGAAAIVGGSCMFSSCAAPVGATAVDARVTKKID